MKWTPAVIERKHVWDQGLFTLTIRAPHVESFKPGQFLQLGYDLPDGHLHRPYSVASPPGELLEFFIVMVEDGRLTPLLWKAQEGDAIDVSMRAAGSFTLDIVLRRVRFGWLELEPAWLPISPCYAHPSHGCATSPSSWYTGLGTRGIWPIKKRSLGIKNDPMVAFAMCR
jgi:hypothetical protein